MILIQNMVNIVAKLMNQLIKSSEIAANYSQNLI